VTKNFFSPRIYTEPRHLKTAMCAATASPTCRNQLALSMFGLVGGALMIKNLIATA
jgi:hypothetical protein